MKVKFKEPEGVAFGYLKSGALFRTPHYGNPLDKVAYMKIEEVSIVVSEVVSENVVATVNAVTMLGKRAYFEDSCLVVPLDGTFVEGYEE